MFQGDILRETSSSAGQRQVLSRRRHAEAAERVGQFGAELDSKWFGLLQMVWPSRPRRAPRRSRSQALATVHAASTGDDRSGMASFQVRRKLKVSLSKKAGVDPKVDSDQTGHGIGVSLGIRVRTWR